MFQTHLSGDDVRMHVYTCICVYVLVKVLVNFFLLIQGIIRSGHRLDSRNFVNLVISVNVRVLARSVEMHNTPESCQPCIYIAIFLFFDYLYFDFCVFTYIYYVAISPNDEFADIMVLASPPPR